jgi:membrane fusion protein, multidrug efflux system
MVELLKKLMHELHRLHKHDWKSLIHKPMAVMIIGVALLFGSILCIQIIKRIIVYYAMQKNATPIVTVSAMAVHYQTWQPTLLTYGSLRAIKGVNVTTELAGLVRKIYFRPGSEVKAGTVLVQLNADSDIALLHALQAQEKLAEITYCRDSAQYEIRAISKETLDTDRQNLKNLRSQVDQQAAIVAKKTITAPFTGRLGICVVNPGQYVNTGDQVVTLQALDPLYADFYIPQQNLVQLYTGATVKIKTDTYPNKLFLGQITTINPIVDVNTRNVEIEATIENPKLELYPGMFVSAEVETGGSLRYLTLPQTAISFNPYGEIVYIVQQKGKNKKGKPVLIAQQAFVVTGDRRGDQIAVLKGLKDGDIVVTSGQLKLKNGSLVAINNTVVPQNQKAPMVQDE